MEAWPAHCYEQMKAAGFRLKPIAMFSISSPGDVLNALEPPWQVSRNAVGVISVLQSD